MGSSPTTGTTLNLLSNINIDYADSQMRLYTPTNKNMSNFTHYNGDPLYAAAAAILEGRQPEVPSELEEGVEEIKKKAEGLKVGDKTNFGVVVEIGKDSVSFKAKDLPKTKISFNQRKTGSKDFVLDRLMKLKEGVELEESFADFAPALVGLATNLGVLAGGIGANMIMKYFKTDPDFRQASKIVSTLANKDPELKSLMKKVSDFEYKTSPEAKSARKELLTYLQNNVDDSAFSSLKGHLYKASKIQGAKLKEEVELEEGVSSAWISRGDNVGFKKADIDKMYSFLSDAGVPKEDIMIVVQDAIVALEKRKKMRKESVELEEVPQLDEDFIKMMNDRVSSR